MQEYNLKGMSKKDWLLVVIGSVFLLPLAIVSLKELFGIDISNYWIPIVYIAGGIYFMIESGIKNIRALKSTIMVKTVNQVIHLVSFGLSLVLLFTAFQLLMPNALSLGFLVNWSKYVGIIAFVWYFVERFVR